MPLAVTIFDDAALDQGGACFGYSSYAHGLYQILARSWLDAFALRPTLRTVWPQSLR